MVLEDWSTQNEAVAFDGGIVNAIVAGTRVGVKICEIFAETTVMLALTFIVAGAMAGATFTTFVLLNMVCNAMMAKNRASSATGA